MRSWITKRHTPHRDGLGGTDEHERRDEPRRPCYQKVRLLWCDQSGIERCGQRIKNKTAGKRGSLLRSRTPESGPRCGIEGFSDDLLCRLKYDPLGAARQGSQ